MNILFLEGDMSRSGGTERMTALLANAFCVTDNVWVISTKFSGNKVFFEFDNRVQHSVLTDKYRKNNISNIFLNIIEIRQFVCEKKIDWVINVDVGMSIFGIPACWGNRTKVVTWEHANYYNNWNSRIFPYFRRFAAKCSDAMVVLTERDKENYEKNIKNLKTIYTIPNPAKPNKFIYNFDSKIILSAGLLSPIKRFDLAIQVAAKVLPKYPDWKWVICGEGPERVHLSHLIKQNKLQNRVILLGTVDNMKEQYRNAAMFVMTSEMEGLPMVLLEAKSWGLPLVSFDIMTGPSDIILDRVNGYLVEPYDVATMATYIEKLISSKEIRKTFSNNSQLNMKRFDFAEIMKKWRKVLEV